MRSQKVLVPRFKVIGSVYFVTQVIYSDAFSTAESSFEFIMRFFSILGTSAGETFHFVAD